jgi:hypothetical protein
MNAVLKSLAGFAITATIMSSAHAALVDQYTLKLPNPNGQTVTDIGALGFNGESFVKNTFAPTAPNVPKNNFTFTDNGVFNITTNNGGADLLDFGQLTANYLNGTGTGSLSGGSITFNAGGTLDLFYNPVKAYGNTAKGGDASNRFGAATGIKIASFTQLAGGGGAINPDGTPSSNGMLTLLFKATYLMDNVWFANNGTELQEGATFGFVTSNASQDVNTINPIMKQILSGSSSTVNNAPNQFFVQNGGQLKLETTDVPEPASLAIFGLGLAGVAFLRRRKA